MTARIKFPTADETKGLGTGKTDYGFTLDSYYSVNTLAIFAGGGYRWMGNPAGFSYRNVWSANGGLSYRATPAISTGLMYDYRQSVYAYYPGASELTPFLAFKLSARRKVQLYGTIGLSNGSADYGAGLVFKQSY